MGVLAKIREEGMQQGMQQGIQQGVQKGESLLLKRQLTLRFGALPTWAETRLLEAQPEQLEHWGEQILNPAVKSLEDILRD